jgi:hypothetical protein
MKWWKNRNRNTMHIKGTWRTQRQNREKGTVKENVKKFHYNSATSNFTRTHTLVLKMWQAGRQTG